MHMGAWVHARAYELAFVHVHPVMLAHRCAHRHMHPTVTEVLHTEASPPTPNMVTPMLIPMKICTPQVHSQLRASPWAQTPSERAPSTAPDLTQAIFKVAPVPTSLKVCAPSWWPFEAPDVGLGVGGWMASGKGGALG